ncbi:MAG: phosphate acetyltransferase, partial [Cryobacterium sp.]|nr:phosphate acetyltransferase [Cryobacterium sp.]
MAQSIYITSVEGNSGKSTIALGVLDTLSHSVARVGVFRPIARSTTERDYVLELLLGHDAVDLDYDDCIGVTYDEVHEDADAALARIIHRYKAVEAQCDAVVIVGSDYTDVGSPTELSYNARIAVNLGAPVLLVLSGRSGQASGERLGQADPRTARQMHDITELALLELKAAHATLLAVVANRADAEHLAEMRQGIEGAHPGVPVWAIPEDPYLIAPSMESIMRATNGVLLKGDPELLAREALGVVVAGMSMVNVLPRLLQGAVLVVAGDRNEVLLAAMMAQSSGTFPSIAGIVLNGGFDLPEPIERLLDGLPQTLPIIRTGLGTYDTIVAITRTRGRLAADSQRKYDAALALFEQHIDASALLELLDVSRTEV